MSIEDLQTDHATLAEQFAELVKDHSRADVDPVASVGKLLEWMQQNLLPYIGNAVNEMDEMDEAISDLVEGTEAISEQTSAILSAPLVFGKPLIELLLRLTPDAKVQAQCRQWLGLHDLAAKKLEEITVEGDDDDDDDDAADDGTADKKGK